MYLYNGRAFSNSNCKIEILYILTCLYHLYFQSPGSSTHLSSIDIHIYIFRQFSSENIACVCVCGCRRLFHFDYHAVQGISNETDIIGEGMKLNNMH